MTAKALPLSTFYKGWGIYQGMLSEMLAPLTAEQLNFPVGNEGWTIGTVAQHVIANRVWWFQNWMGQGGPELAAIAKWDPASPYEFQPRSADELLAGLNDTWQLVQASLDRWTADDLPETFQPPAELSADEQGMFKPVSRQWIIWHVLEHEIHHGGEISLVLGNHGLPGMYGGI